MTDTTGIDYGLLPEGLRDGMRHYIEDRRSTGPFLRAVLRNDLLASWKHASDENWKLMLGIIEFLYYEIPAKVWGSPEAVKAWLAGGDE